MGSYLMASHRFRQAMLPAYSLALLAASVPSGIALDVNNSDQLPPKKLSNVVYKTIKIGQGIAVNYKIPTARWEEPSLFASQV